MTKEILLSLISLKCASFDQIFGDLTSIMQGLNKNELQING